MDDYPPLDDEALGKWLFDLRQQTLLGDAIWRLKLRFPDLHYHHVDDTPAIVLESPMTDELKVASSEAGLVVYDG